MRHLGGRFARMLYQKALHRVRPIELKKDTPKFLYYVISFATKEGLFTANGNQTTIDHLTAEAFKRYVFPFPPFSEQQEIAAKLADATQVHERLRDNILQSINRLREYRSALITAAVTGQIDVATWRKRDTGQKALDRVEEGLPA